MTLNPKALEKAARDVREKYYFDQPEEPTFFEKQAFEAAYILAYEAAKPQEAVSRIEALERVLREADRAITDTLDYRGKPVEQLRMAQTEIDKLNLYTTAARKKG